MSKEITGPVFTKATDKLPPDDNDYFLWINMGDVYIRGVGHYEKEEDRFKDELSGFYYDLARVEWADLSDDEELAPYPPAGPVWVKASERLPDNPGSPQNHWRLDGFHKVNGNFYESEIDDEIVFGVIGNGCHEDYTIRKDKFDRIEFLNDRPAQQTFTREEKRELVRQAWLANYKINCPENEENINHEFVFNEADTWFDLNHPQK